MVASFYKTTISYIYYPILKDDLTILLLHESLRCKVLDIYRKIIYVKQRRSGESCKRRASVEFIDAHERVTSRRARRWIEPLRPVSSRVRVSSFFLTYPINRLGVPFAVILALQMSASTCCHHNLPSSTILSADSAKRVLIFEFPKTQNSLSA